jgi:hypothetical protein
MIFSQMTNSTFPFHYEVNYLQQRHGMQILFLILQRELQREFQWFFQREFKTDFQREFQLGFQREFQSEFLKE